MMSLIELWEELMGHPDDPRIKNEEPDIDLDDMPF